MSEDNILRISASQISNFNLCKRKWWWDKIYKLPRPSTAALDFGKLFHASIENFIKTGKTPIEEDNYKLNKMIFNARKAFLDELREKYLSKPNNFFIEKELTGIIIPGKVSWLGYVDLLEADYDNNCYIIHDHKTAADKKWLKNEYELMNDIQLHFYAHWVDEHSKDASIYLRHNQFIKKPPYAISHVTAKPKNTDLVKNWNKIVQQSAEMYSFSSLFKKQDFKNMLDNTEYAETACKAFGGCEYCQLCHDAVNPEDFTGDKKIKSNNNFNSLLKGENMGSGLLEKLAAKKQAAISNTKPNVVLSKEVVKEESSSRKEEKLASKTTLERAASFQKPAGETSEIAEKIEKVNSILQKHIDKAPKTMMQLIAEHNGFTHKSGKEIIAESHKAFSRALAEAKGEPVPETSPETSPEISPETSPETTTENKIPGCLKLYASYFTKELAKRLPYKAVPIGEEKLRVVPFLPDMFLKNDGRDIPAVLDGCIKIKGSKWDINTLGLHKLADGTKIIFDERSFDNVETKRCGGAGKYVVENNCSEEAKKDEKPVTSEIFNEHSVNFYPEVEMAVPTIYLHCMPVNKNVTYFSEILDKYLAKICIQAEVVDVRLIEYNNGLKAIAEYKADILKDCFKYKHIYVDCSNSVHLAAFECLDIHKTSIHVVRGIK